MPLNHPKDRYRVVACRECRRSKTKCNRVWPCQACVKRGCDDICPDGVLIKPKHDNHLDMYPEAADLIQENKRLLARIRELEKAAATASPQPSCSSHSDSSSTSDPSPRDVVEKFPDEVVNALGTLSIGEYGESNHHNRTASAEYLLQGGFESVMNSSDVITLDGTVLPNDILYLAEAFPNGRAIRPTAELRHMMLSFVPPAEKVLVMVDRYYRDLAWMYDPIPRDQFMDRIYNRIFYGNQYGDMSNVPLDHVSILFIIVALSVVMDLNQPFSHATSEPYYLLALAAFCVDTKLSAPTLASIQALELINTYCCMSERNNSEDRWLLVGITMRMAQSAGLYRDFSGWLKCDDTEIERRRRVFWELYFYDAWLSFNMGRPTVLANNRQCETKFPRDLHSTLGASGKPEPGFHQWKYTFAKECFVPLLDDVHGVDPPTYQTILRLDASIRQYPVPLSLQAPPVNHKRSNVDMSLEMQTYFVLWLKETVLLYLHRSYFAHALTTCPANPLQSHYAPSVLAAYRSACLLVGRLRQLSSDHPVTCRIWTFWSSVFSAAVVLGALVVRSPTCQLSRVALDELDSAAHLLEGSLPSPRSMKMLTILGKLQRRAHSVYAKHCTVDTRAPEVQVVEGDEPEEDELTIYGGETRLIRGPTVTDGRMRHTSPPGSDLKLTGPPRATLGSAYHDLCNNNAPFESVSEWESMQIPGTDGIVPDFSGFNLGMFANVQNHGLSAPAALPQMRPHWQNLMSEVGVVNVML